MNVQAVPESALLDLKHLLIEAQQRVPPVLLALDDPDEDLQVGVSLPLVSRSMLITHTCL